MNTPEPGVERPITIFGSPNRDFTATTVVDPSTISSVPGIVSPIDRTVSGELSSSKTVERPPALSDMPDLAGLVRALSRRWKLALLGGLICSSLTAVAVYFFLPPSKYTTSALVFVAASRPKEIFDTRESSIAYATYQETQVTLAKSRKVIESALKQEGVAKLASVRKQEDPIDWLGREIKVEFPRGSEILRISMTSADPPKDIEMLVNAVTEAYMGEIVEQESRERIARLERLRGLFDSLQKDLRKKRSEYKEIAETMGASNKQNAAVKQQMLIEHMGQARQELLRLKADLRNAQARLKILKSREDSEHDTSEANASNDIEERIEADPEIMTMKERLAELGRQVQSIMRTARKSSDPASLRRNQEILLIKKNLEQRRRALRQALVKAAPTLSKHTANPQVTEAQQYLDILQEQERLVLDEIAVLDTEMNSLNTKSMDFHWLEDEINLSAETAKTVGTEVQSMSVELKAPPRIRLVEKAKAPTLSDPMRRYKFTAVAALGSLCTFLGLLSFWEFRSRRIETTDEVVDGLGLRLVGSLPALARAHRGGGELVQQRLLIESIDAIRTMLLSASRFEALRLLMVTSALKGEGKTSLASHLATSLARAGRKTVLIDCDLRNPSATQVFSAPQCPGVCEFLREEATLDETIWQSPVSSLFLIPAGRWDPATIDLLGQDRLPDLFRTLRDRYEFIIVDTAPVLLVTDSLIISQHVDAVIFSILREVSQIPPVHAAYERLSSLGVRIFGAVVSGVSQSRYAYGSYPYPAKNMTTGLDHNPG
jgi:capsular exopolysaccharide synthesis family protein